MNESFVENAKGRVIDAGKSALTTFAARRVLAIKDLIGIPVEKQGGTIIRSQPGEAPRKEYGDLQNSIQATEPVYLDGVIDIFIFTDEQKAAWLNDGTPRILPRPFWDMSVAEMIGKADELKALYSENFGELAPAAPPSVT
jgi:hypothetical protein